MTVIVSVGDRCLEPDLLASLSLLLHRHKGFPQEKVNDPTLLNWQEEEVNLLQVLDLHVLDLGISVAD